MEQTRWRCNVGAVQAGERAIVVDDLIATGGTLNAAIRLLERVGVDVVECACVIELPELKVFKGGIMACDIDCHGRDRLGDKQLFVLLVLDPFNCTVSDKFKSLVVLYAERLYLGGGDLCLKFKFPHLSALLKLVELAVNGLPFCKGLVPHWITRMHNTKWIQ
ncbi:adenine phosphoribosyltransferase 1 chloroplastic [Phtheirospermum japonicum]|uniref:adenine phosphoribosyltransferase n=1 Tax=Phtheirospermum japonicum TaxID=374723 RepID=A0A830BZP7_9LAMI|nr:adenine phosphoribosyltransferase 1 chloroplastic [Phtheirospermum japonicum]